MLRIATAVFLLSGLVFAQDRLKHVAGDVIRFRFASPNVPLLLVDGRLNGKGPYTFVIDTGARTCLIDSRLATEVGIAATRKEERVGAGGPVQVGVGIADSVSVGESEVSQVEVGISDDLRRISLAAGTEIRGAIGFNFLRHYRVEFDFTRREIRLLNSGGVEGPINGRVSVLFELASKKPLVTVQTFVNGKGPFTFILDTGASATVISEDLARHLEVSLLDVQGQAIGAGSSSIRMRVATLETLAVGNAAIPQLAVGVVSFLTAISTQAGVKIDGVLGFNYLSAFHVTLDYPKRKLILDPLQTATGATK